VHGPQQCNMEKHCIYSSETSGLTSRVTEFIFWRPDEHEAGERSRNDEFVHMQTSEIVQLRFKRLGAQGLFPLLSVALQPHPTYECVYDNMSNA
jgi:hypothetical protein